MRNYYLLRAAPAQFTLMSLSRSVGASAGAEFHTPQPAASLGLSFLGRQGKQPVAAYVQVGEAACGSLCAACLLCMTSLDLDLDL